MNAPALVGPLFLSTAAPEAEAATFLEFDGLAAATSEERREIGGLAVPYGERIERPNMLLGTRFLEFAPGAAKWRDTAQVFYGHDHLDRGLPIGRVLKADEATEGSRITARLSETPKGTEVYTLVRDDVLNRFSIGFYTLAYEVVDADTADATLRVTEADVFEVSVVPDPAYSTAVLDTVLSNNRKETGPMPCASCGQVHAQGVTACQNGPTTFATQDDVRSLTGAIETLERQVATLGTGEGNAVEVLQAPGQSYGEFLQMVARGEAEALEFLQTFATLAATTADLGPMLRDGWVGDRFRMIEDRRRVLNLFSRSPLPASGMNVEFGLVKATSDTTQVGKQAAEGDTLPYGKISFGTDTAPVETYGGWSDLSRQAVERSPISVVERFFDALLNRYAQATEAAVRAELHNAANAHTLSGTGVHDLATADGWIDFVVDAATFLDAKGLPVEFLVVGPDVFKDLAKLRDGANADSPRLLDRNSGSVNIPGLSGDVFNVPVRISPTAPADFVRAGHSSAIRTFEANGAPFRLQDDDITNLTQAMSVYGYMATAVEDAEALVAPDATV